MDLWGWMGELVKTYGYFGAFLIATFGNSTIIFPVPFAITIYAFGSVLNPMLLGLVSGAGSAIGEFSAYLIGRGGRRVVEKRYGARLESAKKLIQRYGMLAVFLFALLPLPDDLILIPLGMMKYDVKKAMASAFLGKTLMCIIIAYAGRFSYTFIKDFFEAGGLLGGVASIILLVIILYMMIKVDWAKFIEPKNSHDAR